MRALLLIAIAGCYNPNAFAPCQTVCAADEGCTPGFVCGDNGYCRPSNIGDCSPTQDSSIQIDADLTDAPPGSICFGTGLIKNFCFAPDQIPTTDLVLPARFDTSIDANCARLLTQNNGPEICVMVGRAYTLPVADELRVIGTRPLAIVTTQGITIAGSLSVASVPGERGAGTASGLLCSAVGIGQPGAGVATGGGGGGGGALTTAGGDGGEGFGVVPGGMGGLTRLVTRVRGGCDGARGGNHDTSMGGQPGAGGGAIYLLTNGVLTVSGLINASGAGGGAPKVRAGGGGGGSGGFIGLDAKTFDIVMARIFASGGSGASGGGQTSDGTPGGIASRDADPGITGGNDSGGPGGNGSSLTKGGNGEPAETNAGGGGGGGGAGYVGFAGPFPDNLSTTLVRPTAKLMN